MIEKTEIVKVNQVNIECPFEKEQHYVAVRSICQALGIDHQKQFERIKNDQILKEVYTDTVYTLDKKGIKQPMFCIPLKFIFGWLFSIDDSKVSEKAKPTFLKYKLECYDALYEHFYLRSALYEKREQLILKKSIELIDLEKQKQDIVERVKNAKEEIENIRNTPVGQLKLQFEFNN